MIQNIIFDIGNVMVHFRWEALMKELGFSDGVIQHLKEHMIMSPLWAEWDRGVMTDSEIISGFKKSNLGFEKEIDIFLENREQVIKQYDFTNGWLQNLKARGYHLYYLSNYPKSLFECHQKHQFKFLSYMEGGVVSSYIHLIKPEPEIYCHLLTTYHLNPAECIFIDDCLANVISARQQGLQGIVFKDYNQASCELETILMQY